MARKHSTEARLLDWIDSAPIEVVISTSWEFPTLV